MCTANHLYFPGAQGNVISVSSAIPFSWPVSALPGRVKSRRGRGGKRGSLLNAVGCWVVLFSNKGCLARRCIVISVMKIAIINFLCLSWILLSTKVVEIAKNVEGLREQLLCDYCLILSLQMPETSSRPPIKDRPTFHLETLFIDMFLGFFSFFMLLNLMRNEIRSSSGNIKSTKLPQKIPVHLG